MKRWLTIGVLALALAGCGTDDSGGGVASAGGEQGTEATEPSLDRDELGVKFAQCMRENGVPMDDPEPGGRIGIKVDGSVGQATVEAAMEACREYNPQAQGGGAADPKMAERARAYAQCMRDNGVEAFPDPQPGGGMRVDKGIADDPDFAAAEQTCQGNLAGGGR